MVSLRSSQNISIVIFDTQSTLCSTASLFNTFEEQN